MGQCGFLWWKDGKCTAGTVEGVTLCNPAERNPRYTRKSLKSRRKHERQLLHHASAINSAARCLNLPVPAHESPDQEDLEQERFEPSHDDLLQAPHRHRSADRRAIDAVRCSSVHDRSHAECCVLHLRLIADDTIRLPELQEKLILGLQKEKPQDDLEEDTEALDALKEESAILATVESLQAAARESKESREEADAEDAAAAAAGADNVGDE